MLTALSLGLRPRESGQLSTIIPHNHGITITYIILYIYYLYQIEGNVIFFLIVAIVCNFIIEINIKLCK